jgi:plastocyanin
MKRILQRTFFVGCGAMLSLTSFGQQQPLNGGFENWDNIGTNDREPTNWNSFRTADCSLTLGCGTATERRLERETDTRPGSSGTYSVRIFSTSALGITANGNLTTGKINIGSTTASSPANHNYTLRSNPNFSMPFSHVPDSLVVWVKFNAANANSMARISASIHGDYNYRDPQDVNSEPYAVGKAVINYPRTNGQWQRLSIPFDYDYPSNDPHYVLITFTTNMIPGGGDSGDEVYVDDLEFIYNPNVVAVNPPAVQNIQVATPGSMLTVTETPNAASAGQTITREWKYSTTSGSGYVSFAPVATGTTFTPQFANPGTYYVVCETSFGAAVVLSNEVVVNVFEEVPNVAAIAPTAVQNIEINQAGTTLTVTETPSAAGSREWKFSTTSGSGYMSFSSDEFGLTYTPLFATAGTYYVVCESDFNGDFVVSNEVQINVSPASGGLNEELIQVVLFQKDNQLVVDLTAAAIENPVFQLISMDGKTVANVKMNAKTSNLVQIDFAPGVYIYQLSNGQTRVDGKIMIK